MSINKTNIAYLFPGQGSQYPGMALDFLHTGSPAVKKLFDEASFICKNDMEALLRDSEEETLKQTDVSQPAITLANLAAAAYLAEQGFNPACCAGFSLGEYAAMVCAGIISTSDCLRLVIARGKAMQESIDSLHAQMGGDIASAPGMAAVIGIAPEQAENLITQWRQTGLTDLYAANINSKKQLAISGTKAALDEAEIRFTEAGALRFLRLQVAGPFHSPLIAGAIEIYKPFLDNIEFHDPVIPVFSNVTGKNISSGTEAKKLALAQITSSVRWVDEEESIIIFSKNYPDGISACFEVGPGTVLKGLWRNTGYEIPCYSAGTLNNINHILSLEKY